MYCMMNYANKNISDKDMTTPMKQSPDDDTTANYSGIRTRKKSAELSKQKPAVDKKTRNPEKPSKTDEVRNVMEGVEVKIDVDALDHDESLKENLDNSDDAQISMSISSGKSSLYCFITLLIKFLVIKIYDYFSFNQHPTRSKRIKTIVEI